MILQIRNSRIGKTLSVFMIFIFLVTLNPLGSYALTGGPAQPEFNSFTPIGTSDMVDLSSGDFSYNIPLMDVGGFPINLAYSSGVTMDQEASWVGLGWDLSIGQINRQMRGLPDDFRGDEVLYENNVKANWTAGATFQLSPELFGFDPDVVNTSISGKYNSYTGYSFTPSAGISYDIAGVGTFGFQAESSPDGLVLSPSISLSNTNKKAAEKDNSISHKAGISMNSRHGLGSFNLSTSSKNVMKKKKGGTKNMQSSLSGSSISFVSNSYTPSVQANMTTLSGTFNTAIDLTAIGLKGETEVTGFGSSQFISNKEDTRPTYGYENTEKAPEEAVLDFNREKDGVFSVNSANLPITNYTYDIYSVQGQGVSGMFHPYRSQVGYVYDDKMVSNSSGLSGGYEAGAGWNADVGLDIEANYTRNRAGIWKKRNEALSEGSFEELKEGDVGFPEDPDYEEVYFKNVGDLSADMNEEIYGYDDGTKLGGYDPVRLKFGYVPYARILKNKYLRKGEHELDFDTEWPYAHLDASGYEIDRDEIKRSERVKRNQTILKVTVDEVQDNFHKEGNFDATISPLAKPHHTAGYIVTRNDGARYNYGKPLYNTKKQEVSFALGSPIGEPTSPGAMGIGNTSTGLVNYVPGVDNSLDNEKGDQYFNRITTPGYGHTFLLTSLVSTDYSDTDGEEGPSAGDFGSYTTFSYRDMPYTYKWRVPFQENKANFNEGLKTNPTDDKGSYVYGEKEVTYIKKIETKTHVAIFHISERCDGFGVAGENGGLGSDSKMYKLHKIELFSRGEYYAPGIVTTHDDDIDDLDPDVDDWENIETTATPIKTVHFEYSYDLCQGIHNNDVSSYPTHDHDSNPATPNLTNNGGKLTLTKVYFTYRNSNMGKYAAYDFTYGDKDHDPSTPNPERNPDYNLKGYDVWGGYKENIGASEGEGSDPLSPISAPEFNYVEQNNFYEEDGEQLDLADDYAAAWSITDISLPSGGEIQIDYESDDYQYVQDKKAMRMFKLAGAGSTADPADSENDFLFDPGPTSELEDQENKEALLFKGLNKEAEYLYFELDEEDQGGISNEEFREKYLKEIYTQQKGLLQFRMFMNMTPKGGVNNGSWKNNNPFDYVSGYCELEGIENAEQFQWAPDSKYYGSVKLKTVKMEGGIGGSLDKVNPISKAGWQFARRYLGQYVYGMPMLEDGTPVGAALEAIYQAFENVAETVAGANKVLREKKISKRFIPEKSWIRLCEPTKYKKGGGCRVRQIAMTDEWAEMTESADPDIINQKYGQEYTYELEEGGSSGVATYEPVGSKENPLVQPVFVNTNRLLAPDDQNYTEKPFGESFFPSPQVTYSRVSVKNLERKEVDGTGDIIREVRKHATGEVVTEFFTSRDYPTITDQTVLRLEEDANPLLAAVFSVNVVKHLTLSQGYSVHTNDMNGKMKSQWVYAEGQDGAISGVEYKYDLTDPEAPSHQFGNQGRLDNKVLTLAPDGVVAERRIGVEQDIINDFREMKSTTQVAGVDLQTNTFAIGPIVLVVPTLFPKYSRHVNKLNIAATTKVVNTFGILKETIAYDAGAAVSTRNKLWDTETGEVLVTETVNEYDDRYFSFNFPAHWNYSGMGQAAFNSGLVLPMESVGGDGNYQMLPGTAGNINDYLHVGDEVLVTSDPADGPLPAYQRAWVTSLTGASGFYLMNADGDPAITTSPVLKVIRSGHRNIQSTSMGSLVMQKNPIDIMEDAGWLLNTEDFAVDGTAGYSWDDKKIVNAGAVEFKDDWDLQCECGLEPTNGAYPGDWGVNPYRYNMKGIWRAYRSHLFLTGRHHDTESANPRNDGFYSNYASFYSNEGAEGWHIPAESFTDWTFTSEVTGYSPYGFELENADALDRYSAAQYGYNFSFPLAVGANTEYSEMGFDGFEDYHFDGCPEKEHFGFRGNLTPEDFEPIDGLGITKAKSHTGRFSLRVPAGENTENTYRIDCEQE